MNFSQNHSANDAMMVKLTIYIRYFVVSIVFLRVDLGDTCSINDKCADNGRCQGNQPISI